MLPRGSSFRTFEILTDCWVLSLSLTKASSPACLLSYLGQLTLERVLVGPRFVFTYSVNCETLYIICAFLSLVLSFDKKKMVKNMFLHGY